MNGAARWLLVRHGETEWSVAGRYAGHRDVPLSARGREQARRLAERLAGEPITQGFASDLSRAAQTAEVILAAHAPRPDLVCCPGLREVHFGAWEGLTFAEIAAQPAAPAVLRGAAAPPGGESLAALAGRVARFHERLSAAPSTRVHERLPSTISSVPPAPESGRGGPEAPRAGTSVSPAPEGEQSRAGAPAVPVVLVVAHGGPLRVLLCLALGLPAAAHWRFQVDQASLTEVAVDAETGARLVALNDRCHLASAGSDRPGSRP